MNRRKIMNEKELKIHRRDQVNTFLENPQFSIKLGKLDFETDWMKITNEELTEIREILTK